MFSFAVSYVLTIEFYTHQDFAPRAEVTNETFGISFLVGFLHVLYRTNVFLCNFSW